VSTNVGFVSPAGKRCETFYEGDVSVRPAVRLALAAATTVAVTLSLTVTLSGPANADPKPAPVPTQAQVDRARVAVAAKRQSVQQIEARLAAANARLEQAALQAGIAAEAYNGAVWRLSEARKAYQLAQVQEQQAKANVAVQRSGIVSLVTDSYQNGTELNTATAMMSDEGPKGLMNRYGVVESAGDSMQARYDAFRTASAVAEKYVAKAARAKDHQKSLTAEAKALAVAAGQAAAAAGAAANQISDQKQQLIQAVAKAENISVGLATRRHAALERIAAQKAAQAARAKEAAQQAALQKAAQQAKKKAEAAKPAKQSTDTGGHSDSDGGSTSPAPSPAPPPVANPAPNQRVAIQRVVAYAKKQLGRPYQWGASGPSRFDCSGLTMRAWGQGGVALPHYSVAQFAQSTRIAMTDARAGDLLFWSNDGSPSGIHHVALYLGGGQFIEAPRTGLNVRYNSIYNWYPDFVARP
jgi:cell wall-associated NlpC family hydrolase